MHSVCKPPLPCLPLSGGLWGKLEAQWLPAPGWQDKQALSALLRPLLYVTTQTQSNSNSQIHGANCVAFTSLVRVDIQIAGGF